MPTWIKPEDLLAVVAYSVLGVVLFVVLFWLLDKLTPYQLWKEIAEKQNRAVATLIGCCAIALGLIISAAMR